VAKRIKEQSGKKMRVELLNCFFYLPLSREILEADVTGICV
jgi:hypothetical protein